MVEAEKNTSEESKAEEANALEQDLTEKVAELRADDDIMAEGAEEGADMVPIAEKPSNTPSKPRADGKRARWYIVHAYSGFEKKIALTIQEKAVQNDIADLIEEVVVPTQDVLEVRRGKKVTSEKKFFPGYLLVKMVLNDASWHMVKNIDKVTDFLGQGGKPQAVPQREVDTIFQQIEEGVTAATSGVIYVIGESVKVTDGPFESFTGVIEEVDEDREKVKVSVAIFGRATPVELDYTQVQKV